MNKSKYKDKNVGSQNLTFFIFIYINKLNYSRYENFT